jgi:hypothetical protein
LGRGCAGWTGLRREIASGHLQSIEEDAGALDVYLVAGQLEEDVADRFLDGGAVLDAVQQERIVGEDGRHVFDRVVVAGVLVVHGERAAAFAFAVGPDALVRLGRLFAEFRIEVH